MTIDNRFFLTMLIIILLVMYFLKTSDVQTPLAHINWWPERDQTNRHQRACRQSTPSTPVVNSWPNILKCVKWETISNMLYWKSEMSKLDNLLGDLDQSATTAPTHPPA